MSTVHQIQQAVGTTLDGIWGPRTRAAVAAKLGCKDDVKAIQAAVGVAQDGKVGPLTLAGIAAKLGISQARVDVFLDVGHTADRAREWPSSFAASAWETDAGRFILAALGFEPGVKDSFEHILNCAVARAVAKHLLAAGVSVEVFDKPEMGNDAEISAVIAAANQVRPRVFVSIHHNAQGGSAWKTMGGTASGHACYYVQGRNGGRALAREISERLDDCRKRYGMPDNRAEHVQAGSYAVIRKLDPQIAATLVEVGFYDNARDVCALVAHLDAVGMAIAEGIRASL